jgi:glutamine amidotransferase
MDALRESALDKLAVEAAESGRPFLGICVGMQMLYEGSDENPETAGLSLLPGRVRLLPDTVKRPQMQWNTLDITGAPPMFDDIDQPVWVYFVHSYAAEPHDGVVATCDYGGAVVAAVQRDRLWATQFHPEKSGRAGLAILKNFVESL